MHSHWWQTEMVLQVQIKCCHVAGAANMKLILTPKGNTSLNGLTEIHQPHTPRNVSAVDIFTGRDAPRKPGCLFEKGDGSESVSTNCEQQTKA